MESKTYLRILEASEERAAMKRIPERLQELSPVARTCVQVFRKDYTAWERRERLMKLPEPSPEELNSILRFFSDFPWWTREAPHLLSPYTGGRRRTLTTEDCEQARKMIADLLEEKWTTTMAVGQAAARFMVSPRTMWKIWYKEYEPKGRSKSKVHKLEK